MNSERPAIRRERMGRLAIIAAVAGASASWVAAHEPKATTAKEAAGKETRAKTGAKEGAAKEQDPARSEGGDIVVTGLSQKDGGQVALPMTILAGDELAHRRQGGLGETLAGLPGVHLDNFGGGASRPVIRGQTLPRIEILSDGANVFDAASVSPDHAIGTDPLLLDAIEIQRGPAAVRYGGNALNGAINLIDGKVPKAMPAGGLTRASEVRYGTGDGEKTVVGRVTAGIGRFAVHAEGARRTSEDYDVPDAYGSDRLRDSFAQAASYGAGASWIASKGYIGAAYTRQTSRYGLPGHSHDGGVCHTHRLDLHCTAHGRIVHPFEGIDDSLPATIDLHSDRIDVRADYDRLLPGLEHVRLRFSHTDYAHQEFDGPVIFSRYTNAVHDGRLELTHVPVLGFTGTLGAQYTNGLFSGLDVSSPNPSLRVNRYRTENTGVFLSERRSFGRLDVEVAARKDWRRLNVVKPFWRDVIFADDLGDPELEREFRERHDRFYARNFPPSRVNPFSASIGATWRFDDGYSAGLSLGRSQRAPGVRELYARNNNLATNSFEVGLARTSIFGGLLPLADPNLVETARSIDLSFTRTGGATEFEVGVFHKDIDDYVFARLISSDGKNRFLFYTPADVRFSGIDGQISHRFGRGSRITIFGDYVDADLTSENDTLPRIPPGRLGARYAFVRGPVAADVEYHHTFRQGRVASYETPTAGYDMLNATVAYRFDIQPGRGVELYVRGTNLTDQLALAHTSFVKDQSPLRGRSVAIGMRHRF